jgi:glyceraldehyde 3-phosphate dehydrogenase
MSVKIAINGFGRIGRPTLRRILEKHPEIEVTAINDLTGTKTLAHLLKYDSIYGQYDKKVDYDEDNLIVGGRKIKILAEKEPEKLPWKDLGIDVVLECTGFFTDYKGAEKHLKAGARRVVISAPSKSVQTPHFVLGVNADKYEPSKDHIVSMGSCTTNCLAPVAKVLHDNFEIESGLMTTIHSYTNTQKLLDSPDEDIRRARAAAISMIPTTTGAATSVVKAIPELEGKIDGLAIRIPTPIVSLVDFVAKVKKETTAEKVNLIFKKAAQNEEMEGILTIEDESLVSIDFKGNSHSAIIDGQATMVERGNLIKVLAWYDNEWGYACRLAEFAEYIGGKL